MLFLLTIHRMLVDEIAMFFLPVWLWWPVLHCLGIKFWNVVLVWSSVASHCFCVQSESLSQRTAGRQSTSSSHAQSDLTSLQHIPENQFPPYATISKGMNQVLLSVGGQSFELFVWFTSWFTIDTGWCWQLLKHVCLCDGCVTSTDSRLFH